MLGAIAGTVFLCLVCLFGFCYSLNQDKKELKEQH